MQTNEEDESRIAFLLALLNEHLKERENFTGEQIENCDLTAIDTHACNLIEIFCQMEGDLPMLDRYYEKAGMKTRFTDLVIDLYGILDKVLARVGEKESIAYFQRLKLMTSIILDLSKV
ncbi:MAG: hypothetical protein H6677_27740 [Candidatus Obscuribacterales bacterium]|nr:hypothetical protein [Candidatus Obscuribacterales bacterium]